MPDTPAHPRMLKTRLILLLLTAALVAAIYLLPKVVVENNSQLTTADSASLQLMPAGHATVPANVAQAIGRLRRQLAVAANQEKSSIFADSLQNLYAETGKLDSAAWFAGQAATFLQTTESFRTAGNRYYEAYTFAMEPAKQAALAARTREFLEKVTDVDPQDFESRNKIAMTFLSSDSPMQGIMMLRQVLEEDPKNELALFNLGMLSIQSGQYQRATDHLSRLVGINPESVQGRLLLGVAHLKSGNKALAKQEFEKVKALDNDPAVQATVNSYLQEINQK